jgi:hypothetical protein
MREQFAKGFDIEVLQGQIYLNKKRVDVLLDIPSHLVRIKKSKSLKRMLRAAFCAGVAAHGHMVFTGVPVIEITS